MSHFVGKINFKAFLNVKIGDVEYEDGTTKKCVIIPIKDNEIVSWNDELQYWFRAFGYSSKKTGSFTHFLMKFVPKNMVSKLNQEQIEKFSSHQIGQMKKNNFKSNEKEI